MSTYTVLNKYSMWAITAKTDEHAREIAAASHPLKRGWTGTWLPRKDFKGWFYEIRNSKGREMKSEGYGCSLIVGDKTRSAV